MSIKTPNVQKMFPNRAVNKNSPLACGLGAGDWAGSHFHTGRPDLDPSPTENSSRARSAYKEKRERGGGRENWGDGSLRRTDTWERKKKKKKRKEEETKNDLMAFPPVFRFLCKTVNLVKFIFFAASVFYKGSFNLFLLSPVGDPRSCFFFPPTLLCSTLFSPPRRLYLSLLLPSVFSSLSLSFLPLWKWVF